jgi:hypothetical protein
MVMAMVMVIVYVAGMTVMIRIPWFFPGVMRMGMAVPVVSAVEMIVMITMQQYFPVIQKYVMQKDMMKTAMTLPTDCGIMMAMAIMTTVALISAMGVLNHPEMIAMIITRLFSRDSKCSSAIRQ